MIMPLGFAQLKTTYNRFERFKLTVTRGKTIPYVDVTIRKKLWRTLMRLFLAQFI